MMVNTRSRSGRGDFYSEKIEWLDIVAEQRPEGLARVAGRRSSIRIIQFSFHVVVPVLFVVILTDF